MKRINKVFIATSLLALVACTNDKNVKPVLEAEGCTNIQFTGYRFFTCGQDDFYHTGFEATKNGHKISGTVCEGLLMKGKTIRYD